MDSRAASWHAPSIFASRLKSVPDIYIDTAQADTVGKPPLKVVFFSPFILQDAASGAAQSIRTMLEQLAARGVSCHALTACCFDVPPGPRLAEVLQAQGLRQTGIIKEIGMPVWQGHIKGVDYNAIHFASQTRHQFSPPEEITYRDMVRIWLKQNKPDVVITFGGLLLDVEIQRCARAAGALLVFYLANPSYGRAETFARVDLIVTNSEATSAHYRRTLSLDSQSVGLFVDPGRAIAARREPQFVTFINPLPEKGVTLFLKLVERAAAEAPDLRFLVVESRGKLADALQKTGKGAALAERITLLPKQDDIAAVYGVTKILLMPSFWFEAAGRILIEANANGIPVLASDGGGIPETLGGAGKLLSVPDRCMQDHWAIPSDEEAEPWWRELLRLWREPAHYQSMSELALSTATAQTVAAKAERLEALLRAALAKKNAGTSPA
ncbi:MAG: glycosyltransferase family 4 protein [Burkholderiaceae bacterium]|nr:glycosyltransferase family 4 protein [Burkholderiaceae bacterium]